MRCERGLEPPLRLVRSRRKMVVGAGLAPALFLVSQIYSLLPSLLGTPHEMAPGRRDTEPVAHHLREPLRVLLPGMKLVLEDGIAPPTLGSSGRRSTAELLQL